MEVVKTAIEGVLIIKHKTFLDNRGEFKEWFQCDHLKKHGIELNPKQSNISISEKGVIRGIHYSLSEECQNKYVTCLNGSIIDVLVDLRNSSPTYLEKIYVRMSPSDQISLYIPHGVGHSFQALESNTLVIYALSSIYRPEKEFGINPLDSEIEIKWPIDEKILSMKDEKAPSFNEAKNAGKLPQ